MNKTGIVILLVMAAAFFLIVWACDLVGSQFGKAGEILALSAVAAVLLAGFMKSKGDK
ncbi:MAG: hypothetical protein PUK54_04780 [Firmicutes bacterium]|nr:hypothetical protein [Bacillota bacterium]MDD7601908.1 hypothetical protein [Bacillota bacterium]MDY5855924.1 hypothetical protein [Anaerovoracaceae bacterium]